MGQQALIAQASRNHDAQDNIQHQISDVLIDVQGDEASIRANLNVTFARRGDAPGSELRVGEVYRFAALRTAQGWRLARVETTLVWTSRPLPVNASR